MEFTELELKYWWRGMARIDKHELLENVNEKATSDLLRLIASRVQGCLNKNEDPEPKDLIAIRKWWHR